MTPQTAREKPKNEQRRPQRVNPGCLLSILALITGLLVGAAALFIVTAPMFLDFFGIGATSSAIDRTAAALNATSSYYQQQAVDFQRTQTALDNQQALLNQTATQGARDVVATQTALAISNEQQQTQAAIDYASTQSALNQIATQVELDFAATRAAINQNATAAGSVQLAPTLPAPGLLLDDNFLTTINEATWNFPAGAWALTGNGITATFNPSWMLSRRLNFERYRLDLRLTPLQGIPGDYDLLFTRSGAEKHILVRLESDGQQFTHIGIFSWQMTVSPVSGLYSEAPQLIERHAVALDMVERRLTVESNGTAFSIRVDDTPIFALTLVEPLLGAVGLQMPSGATIRALTLASLN